MNLISINSWTRQAVLMGKNYAYTLHRMSFRCWLNPATQNDRPSDTAPSQHGGPGGILIGGALAGPLPVVSDAALRHDLMQPRGFLNFDFLGTNSFSSPLPGATVDCCGGPIPISCSIHQVTPRTWVVDWTVETYVNENYRRVGSETPVILAHAFSMKHALDQDFWTTRVLEGQALFRLDALQVQNFLPDDFRTMIFIVPPDGFKRESVEVSSDPENPGLISYKVVDRQLPLGWSCSHATKLEAYHTIETSKACPYEIEVGARIKKAVINLKQVSGLGSNPISSFAGVVGGAGELYSTEFEAFSAALPLSTHTIDVSVWGDSLSTRKQLEQFARDVVSARLSAFFVYAAAAGVGQAPTPTVTSNGIIGAAIRANWKDLTAALNQISPLLGQQAVSVYQGNQLAQILMAPFGVHTKITHDLTGKNVHLTYSAFSGPVQTLLSGGSSIINVSPMPDTDETLLNGSPLITTTLPPGPWPPVSTGSRGSYIADLVTAALVAPYGTLTDLPAGQAPITKGLGVNYYDSNSA